MKEGSKEKQAEAALVDQLFVSRGEGRLKKAQGLKSGWLKESVIRRKAQ